MPRLIAALGALALLAALPTATLAEVPQNQYQVIVWPHAISDELACI